MRHASTQTRRPAGLLRVLPPRGAIMAIAWAIALAAALLAGRPAPATPAPETSTGIAMIQH